MNVKSIVSAAIALLITLPAAFAEPQFYMRTMRSGVLHELRVAEPEAPVSGPVTCATLPNRGTVTLPGFVSADWLFAASYLGCRLPAVAGTVSMASIENGPLAIGRRPISTSLVVASCGMNVPEMANVFSLGLEGKTLAFYTKSSPAPATGGYGATVMCFLETAAGIPAAVMVLPLEIIVP